jgi:hypothetical protein
MELRWLKGKWPFGKFKLQYRIHEKESVMHDAFTSDWIDVPIADLSPESKEPTVSKPCHPSLHPEANVYGLPKCLKCWNYYRPEPTVSQKDEKVGMGECPHVYESDCHGIEMIKDPNGKEWAIGGTNTTGRWKYDPWCGKSTPRPKELSRVERLAKVLFEKMYNYGFIEGSSDKKHWEDMAESAIKFLNENPE